MVSYYNSLAMFPQPSRPGSGPPPPSVSASSLYSSYSHYNQYSAVAGQSLHDQNSNLQLYAGFSPDTAFSPAPGSHRARATKGSGSPGCSAVFEVPRAPRAQAKTFV